MANSELPSIDPIAVKEKNKRFGDISKQLVQAKMAADALEWFHSYGQLSEGGRGLTDIYRVRIEVVAGATYNSGDAEKYIKQAFEKYRKQILIDAIENAKRDMHALDRVIQIKKD